MFKSLLFKRLAVTTMLLAMATLVACSPKRSGRLREARSEPAPGDGVAVDLRLDNIDGNAAATANKFVDNAEKMMTPMGFMFAYEVIELALKKDPNNKKAQLYRAMLKPMMRMRGIVRRIEPLMTNQSPQSRAEQKRGFERLGPGGLRDFLLDGKPDLTDEKSVQAFLTEWRKDINESRLTMRAHKSLVFKVRLTRVDDMENALAYCSVTKTGEGRYDIAPCPATSMIERKVDRADLEILQQYLAGLQIYMTVFTAYDFSGLMATGQQLRQETAAGGRELSADEIRERYLSLGRIRKAAPGTRAR